METMFSLGIWPSTTGALVQALHKRTHQLELTAEGNHYHIKLCCPLMYHKDGPQKLMVLKVSSAITQLNHYINEHRQMKPDHFCSPLIDGEKELCDSELLRFQLKLMFPNIH
jgi:hypothetical protein